MNTLAAILLFWGAPVDPEPFTGQFPPLSACECFKTVAGQDVRALQDALNVLGGWQRKCCQDQYDEARKIEDAWWYLCLYLRKTGTKHWSFAQNEWIETEADHGLWCYEGGEGVPYVWWYYPGAAEAEWQRSLRELLLIIGRDAFDAGRMPLPLSMR